MKVALDMSSQVLRAQETVSEKVSVEASNLQNLKESPQSPQQEDKKEGLFKKGVLNAEELKEVIEEIQKKFDLFSKYMKMEVDEELDVTVVKIIDKETNKVIRQVPPEYMLELLRKFDEMLGLLVSERV